MCVLKIRPKNIAGLRDFFKIKFIKILVIYLWISVICFRKLSKYNIGHRFTAITSQESNPNQSVINGAEYGTKR